MNKKVTEDLKRIFSRVMNIDLKMINDELSRDNAENWDSFNHLLLISEIEKELGINISLPEVEEIRTFKELQEIVKTNQKLHE